MSLRLSLSREISRRIAAMSTALVERRKSTGTRIASEKETSFAKSYAVITSCEPLV